MVKFSIYDDLDKNTFGIRSISGISHVDFVKVQILLSIRLKLTSSSNVADVETRQLKAVPLVIVDSTAKSQIQTTIPPAKCLNSRDDDHDDRLCGESNLME